ncbi:MAG: hypothetical protein K0R92_89 [Lachnospiraceae bacterium]|jgi:geranylgeranyl diphosphate synthase type II|nr:hypothetical protein [Lachnospiraceae bacterium]
MAVWQVNLRYEVDVKMNQEKFDIERDQRVAYIEEILSKYLPKETGYQKTVLEAMNYSVLAGGKRLRPMLILETYRLFGGEDTSIIEPFMAAIEMIHTYSLVHDDLPAMDNDEFRRGRKTTHVVYGEAMGILAGDGLLNYAFETACHSLNRNISGNMTPEAQLMRLTRTAKALEILSVKAGIYGMIGGQVIDVEGTMESLEQVLNMYQLKTGALIEASMMIGAVLSGADENALKIIEQMASDIGLAFQIQDDILDVTSTLEVLGKPIHSDERNEKSTFVAFVGLEQGKKEVVQYSARGLEGFRLLGRENEFLRDMMIYLINREK